MGYGLWLSRRALDECDVDALRAALDRAGLFVFTMNGFPYGDFHGERVKHAVYTPDWADPRRLDYSLGLAEVLAALLPEGVAGTISTLPIGYRAMTEAQRSAAVAMLGRAVAGLAELRERTGRGIRLCLEPEPGCVLETATDAVALFEGIEASDHLGLCYDTCHQAVVFEDASASVGALLDAGVAIGKVQLSSALVAPTASARAALMRFDEPRFLHQVRTAGGDGVDDLGDAHELPDTEWRVHFHVPIHRQRFGELGTTRAFLEAAVVALKARGAQPCFEVETYTWTVLPEAERPSGDRGLIEGIAAELAFAQELLS